MMSSGYINVTEEECICNCHKETYMPLATYSNLPSSCQGLHQCRNCNAVYLDKEKQNIQKLAEERYKEMIDYTVGDWKKKLIKKLKKKFKEPFFTDSRYGLQEAIEIIENS